MLLMVSAWTDTQAVNESRPWLTQTAQGEAGA